MTNNTFGYIRKILKLNCDTKQDALLRAIENNNGETFIRNAIADYRSAFVALDEFEGYMASDKTIGE